MEKSEKIERVRLAAYLPGESGDGRPLNELSDGRPCAEKSGGGRLRPAVIICPGGGYRIVGTSEGAPVAARFAAAGYAAFVLNYSVGDFAAFDPAPGKGFSSFRPVLDLLGAMKELKGRADEYGIDASDIFIAGFSAGGHLTTAYTFAESASGVVGAEHLPRALLLSYPMGGGADGGGRAHGDEYDITRMPYRQDAAARGVPVFLWHGRDDDMVPFSVSEALDGRLTREGIAHRFYAAEHARHAQPFACGDGWFAEMLRWIGDSKGLSL
jgi:acetyl esterase/lipase